MFKLLRAKRPSHDIFSSLAVAPPHGNISFSLAAAPPHVDISSSLPAAPPHGNISFTPHGGNLFSLHLKAIIDFIPPTRRFMPHGNIDFLFASWR
jgi:hypothetical protein